MYGGRGDAMSQSSFLLKLPDSDLRLEIRYVAGFNLRGSIHYSIYYIIYNALNKILEIACNKKKRQNTEPIE